MAQGAGGRWKTRLCIHWLDSGGRFCKFGEACAYAHGTGELRPSAESVASLREEACAAAERTVTDVVRVCQQEGLLRAERGALVAETTEGMVQLAGPPHALDVATTTRMATLLLQSVSVTLPPLPPADPMALLVSVASEQGVPLVLVAGEARQFLRQLVSYEMLSVQPFGIRSSTADLLRLVFTRAFRHCVSLLDRVRVRVPSSPSGSPLAGDGAGPLTRALLSSVRSEHTLDPYSAAGEGAEGRAGAGLPPLPPPPPLLPQALARPPVAAAAGDAAALSSSSSLAPVRISPLEERTVRSVATAPALEVPGPSSSGAGGGVASPITSSDMSALLRTTTDPHLAARLREQQAAERAYLLREQQAAAPRSRSFRSEGDARSLAHTSSFASSGQPSVVTIAGHEVLRDLARAPHASHAPGAASAHAVPPSSSFEARDRDAAAPPRAPRPYRDSLPLSVDDHFWTIEEELGAGAGAGGAAGAAIRPPPGLLPHPVAAAAPAAAARDSFVVPEAAHAAALAERRAADARAPPPMARHYSARSDGGADAGGPTLTASSVFGVDGGFGPPHAPHVGAAAADGLRGVRFLPATTRIRSTRDSTVGGIFSFEPSTASSSSSSSTTTASSATHSSYRAHAAAAGPGSDAASVFSGGLYGPLTPSTHSTGRSGSGGALQASGHTATHTSSSGSGSGLSDPPRAPRATAPPPHSAGPADAPADAPADLAARMSAQSLASTSSANAARILSFRGDSAALLHASGHQLMPRAHARSLGQAQPSTAWFGGEDLGDVQHVDDGYESD